jgi:hypothetical protein
MSPERLSEIDEALDAFGIPQRKLARSIEAARGAKMSLAEVDAALESLAGRFETRVPEGALARSGSWAREPSSDERDAGSGLVDINPAAVDASQLPAVLSERPPPAEDETTTTAETRIEAGLDAKDGASTGQTPALMADEDPVDPEARPSIEIMVEAGDGSLRDSLFDGIGEGTDVHGRAEIAAAEAELAARPSQAPTSSSALELELEAEPAPRIEQSSAKFSVPKDSVHPSPKSVIPPPPGDLDADLASILADELEPAPAPEPADGGDELEAEATALFSADMFGAAGEPSLAELISRPPPAQSDGDSDSLEIEIDEDVLVYEAAPEPPVTGTRPPPPPGRSAPPPPAKPGFLGRLLNRKP